jgi:hypothetical protein
MLMVPEVTVSAYPPLNAPVTVSVSVPEAGPDLTLSPLVADDFTTCHAPFVLVNVIVCPGVREVGVGMTDVVVLVVVVVAAVCVAAIAAGYARSSATIAKMEAAPIAAPVTVSVSVPEFSFR